MSSLRYLSLLFFLAPLAAEFNRYIVPGSSVGMELKDGTIPPPKCDLANIHSSIRAYLKSEASELQDRATYNSKYNRYVKVLTICPRFDTVVAYLNYFKAVVARMEAEKVGDTLPNAAATNLASALNFINLANDALADQAYILNERGIIYEMQASLQWLPRRRRNELYTKAEDDFKGALSQEKDWALAHSNLGNVRVALGNAATAVLDYQQAIRQKSDLAVANLGLGNLLLQSGLNQDAINKLEKAHTLLDSTSETTYGYARGLLARGNPDDITTAKSLLTDLLDDKYNPSGRGRGKAYYAMGKYQLNTQYDTTTYKNAADYLGEQKSLSSSYYQLGKLYSNLNKKGNGRYFFKRKTQRTGSPPLPDVLAGYIHLQSSSFDTSDLTALFRPIFNGNTFNNDEARFDYLQDMTVVLFQLGDTTWAEHISEWIINRPNFRHNIEAYHTYINILLKNMDPNSSYSDICNKIVTFRTFPHLDASEFKTLVCNIDTATNWEFYLGLTSSGCWQDTVMQGFTCNQN